MVIYILNTKQRICGRWGVPGVENCLFLRAQGWGIDHQVRKKLQTPGGVPGGGVVTGKIEPCIRGWNELVLEWKSFRYHVNGPLTNEKADSDHNV